MSINRGKVNKIALAATAAALFSLLAAAALCAGEAGYVVRPVAKPADVRLLSARAWPPPESDKGEMLLKLSYLRGLMDALQYTELAPSTAGQVLEHYKGRGLAELAAQIDRFYLRDPSRRDLPPAAVLFRVLPGRGEDKGMRHTPLFGTSPKSGK